MHINCTYLSPSQHFMCVIQHLHIHEFRFLFHFLYLFMNSQRRQWVRRYDTWKCVAHRESYNFMPLVTHILRWATFYYAFCLIFQFMDGGVNVCVISWTASFEILLDFSCLKTVWCFVNPIGNKSTLIFHYFFFAHVMFYLLCIEYGIYTFV